MPHFFRQYGRVSLSGDIIGCAMQGRNNCHSSSVIAAYWPGSGSSLLSTDYSRKRIGVVQYFIQHSAEFYKDQGSSSETEKLPHLFCYVHWKKEHPKANWFGISAIVCDDCFETPDACSFMPVQRITNKCAFAKLNIKFERHEDFVFIACPVPIKY